MYKSCVINIGIHKLFVDFIVLDMHDFGVILGLDWLSIYHPKVDCCNKVVTFLVSYGVIFYLWYSRIISSVYYLEYQSLLVIE